MNVDTDNVVLSAVIDYKQQLLQAKRFIIVACGTSWHAGLIGKQMIEQLCRIPVEVEYASEFRYRHPVITNEDVVIAIRRAVRQPTRWLPCNWRRITVRLSTASVTLSVQVFRVPPTPVRIFT